MYNKREIVVTGNILNLEEYQRVNWKNHYVKNADLNYIEEVDKSENGKTVYRITNLAETIQPGTPFTENNMNRMDEGIYVNREALRSLSERLVYLEIQATINDILIGIPNDNTFKQYFTDIDWCEINRGIYAPEDSCLMLNEYK